MLRIPGDQEGAGMVLPCFTERETEAQNEEVTGPGTDRAGLELYPVTSYPVNNKC